MERPRAGLVGLGLMGGPMARHLLSAGLELTCCDLDEDALQSVGEAGASIAASPGAVAAASDVTLVVVPSDDDVTQVCLGEGGLLEGAARGSVIVICSSVTPRTCVAVAEQAAAVGVGVLDAPLTGGIRGAEAGSLVLLIGGDDATLERARPVLEPVSAELHVLGPVGAGQVGKTINNVIHWGEIVVITEALALGAELGVDVSRLRPALSAASVDSRTLRELEDMRFTWHAKDLANAFRMAEDVGVPVDVARLVARKMPSITPERVDRLLRDQGWDSP